MMYLSFEYKGHNWVYFYRPTMREAFIHRIYQDSRQPEQGFSLWHVLQAIRAPRG